MKIKEIQGLKFPDLQVTRFFFKENHNSKTGRVLELGSGNGNNLMLFYEYGYEVVGVDIDKTFIDQANYNFTLSKSEDSKHNSFLFHSCDMLDYLKNYSGPEFDIILIPNSLYYLVYEDILLFLTLLKKLLKKDSFFFCIMRDRKDYRFGKGSKLNNYSYKLEISETGEEGAIITFFEKTEILNLLSEYINLKNKIVLESFSENIQSGVKTWQSDITIWGMIED
jgi:SAM-dependent methyltransferase